MSLNQIFIQHPFIAYRSCVAHQDTSRQGRAIHRAPAVDSHSEMSFFSLQGKALVITIALLSMVYMAI